MLSLKLFSHMACTGKPRNKNAVKSGWNEAPAGYYPDDDEIVSLITTEVEVVKKHLSRQVDNGTMGTATRPAADKRVWSAELARLLRTPRTSASSACYLRLAVEHAVHCMHAQTKSTVHTASFTQSLQHVVVFRHNSCVCMQLHVCIFSPHTKPSGQSRQEIKTSNMCDAFFG